MRNSRGRSTKGGSGRRHQNRRKSSAPAKPTAAGPYPLGTELSVAIEDIGHGGEGVGKTDDGYTVFVPGVLPGETARCELTAGKAQYGFARLLEVPQQSEHRVTAPCAVFDRCGGCQLQHLSYAAQLLWKQRRVVDSLERIGGVEQASALVAPVLGMADEAGGPWTYRNKSQVPVTMGRHADQPRTYPVTDGVAAGYYAKSSHAVVETDRCLIQPKAHDEIVRAAAELANELGILAYDESKHKGWLRHVVVRSAVGTGERMVVLVTNGRDMPHRKRWIARMQEAADGVVSLMQNVNTARTNVIFGDETLHIWGKETIREQWDDLVFEVSARSFLQINPVQTMKLYQKTLDYAGLTGQETVVDAYCGIGTITMFLARKAGQVIGVEIVEQAIIDARQNAELNGINNVTFHAGRAEQLLPKWQQEGLQADVVVVDPPRKGCDPQLLEAIAEMKPSRVVYVSCNPSTLARDVKLLVERGYRLDAAQPVDMFPHTTHVECVVLMSRVE